MGRKSIQVVMATVLISALVSGFVSTSAASARYKQDKARALAKLQLALKKASK